MLQAVSLVIGNETTFLPNLMTSAHRSFRIPKTQIYAQQTFTK